MRTKIKSPRQLPLPEGCGFPRILMNRFSQLNTNPSLQVTWAGDAGVVSPEFKARPFSQLNHANIRRSGQSRLGALTKVYAFASLGGLHAFSQLNANPPLQVTWAGDARVVPNGLVAGPFSQLNALTAWTVLGYNQKSLPAHLFPSLWAKCHAERRDHGYLNTRSYTSDEPRTTRGSVHLEPKF